MAGGWWGTSNAKRQFLRRLYKRAGYPLLLTFEDPFVFQTANRRWRSIDQLEAVVEFYRNFADPWVKNGPAPPSPGDAAYFPVSLRPLAGTAAQIVPGQVPTVKLDGEPDLRWILPDPGTAANPAQAAWPANPKYPQPRRYLFDTLFLEADTQRPGCRYRIMSVDHASHTVTLDSDQPGAPGPKFPDGTTTSNWKISSRPFLVLIDSFGARWQGPGPGQPGQQLIALAGAAATVDANDNQLLHLDGQPDLSRVNAHFDTIYLPTDTVSGRGLPQRAYRIIDVNAGAWTVRIDGAPVLTGGSSAWNIPAGLSAKAMPPFRAPLGAGFTDHFDPPADAAHPQRALRGHDHYDGALFLVYGGEVKQWYRWTSYTSRDHGSWKFAGAVEADWRDETSSVRGNQPYLCYSYRSPGRFKNYTLMVTDPRSGNTGISWADQPGGFGDPSVQESLARYYYGNPDPNTDALGGTVESDDNGKKAVEFHRGNVTGTANTGSGGCLVSPSHIDLRNHLIGLYLDDYKNFYGVDDLHTDPYLRNLMQSCKYQSSEDLWKAETAADGVRGYNKKLAGILWLIRPDEPPLGDPTR
jgi:hypothetical protein